MSDTGKLTEREKKEKEEEEKEKRRLALMRSYVPPPKKIDPPKSPATVLMLSIFAGSSGIHDFVTKRTGTGLVILITAGLGGIMILAHLFSGAGWIALTAGIILSAISLGIRIHEWWQMAHGKFKDGYGRTIRFQSESKKRKVNEALPAVAERKAAALPPVGPQVVPTPAPAPILEQPPAPGPISDAPLPPANVENSPKPVSPIGKRY
jgi:TM2 domain-containing membrane protein YozV